jgi:hypothetical protein
VAEQRAAERGVVVGVVLPSPSVNVEPLVAAITSSSSPGTRRCPLLTPPGMTGSRAGGEDRLLVVAMRLL